MIRVAQARRLRKTHLLVRPKQKGSVSTQRGNHGRRYHHCDWMSVLFRLSVPEAKGRKAALSHSGYSPALFWNLPHRCVMILNRLASLKLCTKGCLLVDQRGNESYACCLVQPQVRASIFKRGDTSTHSHGRVTGNIEFLSSKKCQGLRYQGNCFGLLVTCLVNVCVFVCLCLCVSVLTVAKLE